MAIDLNADLGEGFGRWTLGDDEALLDVITSANVACGFHAGDPSIMRRTCAQAVERGVVIGAQVGYRDLAGFGRRRIDMAPPELTADVVYQLGALEAFARIAGGQVGYLKPHGALYNTAVVDAVQAQAVVDAVLAYDRALPILTLPRGVLARLAEAAGITVIAEAFADRTYQRDATLTPREQDRGVLHDAALIAERAVRIAVAGEVVAADGSTVRMHAASLCVHGDTPGAVEIARAVKQALTAAGVAVRSFV
ncbi:MAG TPA: 5-oxoprolinase subunit PxpA [Jatrophihabitans sp.]